MIEMEKPQNIILKFMAKNGRRCSVEQVSGLLSKKLEKYHSGRDAQGYLESLRTEGFVMYGAPTGNCWRSQYPYFLLTPKGDLEAERGYGSSFDTEAYKLWLLADC